MSRSDYSTRNFVGARAVNLADPTLASDVANKGYIDGIAAGAAADAQPRLSAVSTALTVPSNGQTNITNWTVSVNRSFSYSSPYFAPAIAGVYAISFSGLFSAAMPTNVRAFVTILATTPNTYYHSNLIIGETIGTATAVLGMNAGEGLVCAVYQNSGTSRTWSGIFNAVRVSAI